MIFFLIKINNKIKSINQNNCGVIGCKYCKPGEKHLCRNCGMKPSNHFTKDCQVFGLVYMFDGVEILTMKTENSLNSFDLFNAKIKGLSNENVINEFKKIINEKLKNIYQVKTLDIISSYMIPEVGKVYVFYLKTDKDIQRGNNKTDTFNLMVFDDGYEISENPNGNYGEKNLRFTLAFIKKLDQNFDNDFIKFNKNNKTNLENNLKKLI